MAGVNYSITLDDEQIHKRLNKLIQQSTNLQPAFQDIGEMLLISHDQRFREQKAPDGTPWAPLSPTSRELKPKNKDVVLTLNAHLRDNLNYIATGKTLFFGTPMEYGAMHQFGGTTAPNSMIPGKEIPARPWLGVTEDDKAEIFDILGDFLLEV